MAEERTLKFVYPSENNDLQKKRKILHVSLLINRQVAHEQKRDISFLVIKKIHQDFQSSQNMFIIR